MDRVGFVENEQISLDKVRRYVGKHEYLYDPIWREIFTEAITICFQKSKMY